MNLLAIAVTGFLVSLKVPPGIACKIGLHVETIIANEWERVSDRVRKLTIGGIRKIVGVIVKSFCNVYVYPYFIIN